MFKSTLLSIFVLMAFALQAQISIGPKANLGLSMYRPNDAAGEFRKGSMAFAYSGGVQVDWRFGSFGVAPEVLFTRRTISSKISQAMISETEVLDVESTVRVNSIDVPLMLKYFFRGKEFGAYIQAGPQLNFNIGGEATEDFYVNEVFQEGSSYSEDLRIGSTRTDSYKGTDFGFAFGGGVFIDVTSGQINLDLRYRLGGTEQLINGDQVVNSRANFRTGDLFLSLAYVFPLGGKW